MKHLKIIYCFLLVFSILVCCTGGVFAEFAAIPTIDNMYQYLEDTFNIQTNPYSRSILGALYWILDRVDTYLPSISQGVNNVNSNVNYWGQLINNNAGSISSRVSTLNDTIKYAVFGSTTIDTSKSVYSMISSLQSTVASGNSILADIDLYAPFLGTISNNVAEIGVDVDALNTTTSGVKTNTDSLVSYLSSINGKLDSYNNNVYYSIGQMVSSVFDKFVESNILLNDMKTGLGALDSRLASVDSRLVTNIEGQTFPIVNLLAGNVNGTYFSIGQLAAETYKQLITPHSTFALVNGQNYTAAQYLDYIASNLNNISISGDLTANVDLSETNSLIDIGNSRLSTISNWAYALYSSNRASNGNGNPQYPQSSQIYSAADWIRFNYNRLENINNSLSAADGQNYKTIAELSLETNDKLDHVIDLLSQIAPDSSVDTSNKESVINWYNNLNFGDTELGDLALDLPSFDIAIVIPDIDVDSKDFPFAEIAAYTAGYFAGDANTGGW